MSQGVALRNDINQRLTDITAITTERYHEHMQERRGRREVRSMQLCMVACE